MAAPTRSEGLFGFGFMEGYRPLAGVRDEMAGEDGAIRPHWRVFLSTLGLLGQEEAEQRFEQMAQRLQATGATYRVFDTPGGRERPWPVSRLPLLMSPGDWREICAGVVQRARMQEALLQDLYGPQTLIADGVLPASIVAGSPEFLRPLVGVRPRGGKFLRLYAADLGRGPDGRWWVMADRTQGPSGAGYALENRLALSAALPEAFGALDVHRLAGFFQRFRESLAALAEPGGAGVCVLTPGPLNETYFEHAYLARYLGFLLVEGEDLAVRDDKVFVRTVAGLRGADAFIRRLDADFADPLELNAQSRIGAPGLVRAARAGNVTFANALGSGLAESRALLGFHGALARRLLGEELRLPNVATWWCGQGEARDAVIAQLSALAIAPAFSPASSSYTDVQVGAELDGPRRARLIEALTRRGVDYVGQEIVSLSTMPVWSEGRLTPRPFQIRVYAAATEDGWIVMPGGFCRAANSADARAISMQMGGLSADVWVLSEGPVAPESLLPAEGDIEVKRHVGALTSRAADNLFWFGRYLERAEATIRLIRAGHAREALNDRDERAVSAAISALLIGRGALTPHDTLLNRKVALAALVGSGQVGTAADSVAAARRAASHVRERLATDVISTVDELADTLDPAVRPRSDPQERADRALRLLAAIAGLIGENMAQLTGWRFLEMGRRIERGLATLDFVRALGVDHASGASLSALLELGDSSITYAQRYFIAPARRPVLDLLMLDDNNPRACAFQIRKLGEMARQMPGEGADESASLARRLVERLSAEMIAIEADSVDAGFVARVRAALLELSDALSERYLVNRNRLAFSYRVDE
ncbi:MAG TPA: circularly permuted type 2 ATP-grasp protein [Caulobacterales bacterium]|nr:circularly permuted type 2 ATP-grasp protein [Caulobacterales bacterium]